MKVNGEAIFKTKPWSVCQNETASHVFYTTKGKTLYALIRQWPVDDKLKLQFPIPTDETTIRLLGMPSYQSLKWSTKFLNDALPQHDERELGKTSTSNAAGLLVELPHLNPANMPCHHAWVVAITGIANIKA